MAFEKMTAKALFEKFQELFPDMIMGNDTDWATVTNYTKIGARMLRMEFNSGPVLYFLWYDENNWNLGTKPYRNRPVKQMYKKLKEQDMFANLKKDVECLPQGVDLTKMDLDLKTLVAAGAISVLTGAPLSDEKKWKEDMIKAMDTQRYEIMKTMNEQCCAEITGCNQSDPGKEFVDAFIKCAKLAANPDVEAASIAYLASLGGIDPKDIDPKASTKVIREAGVIDLDNPKCQRDLEPIDWVKDDSDMLEKGVRVTQGHPEWDDVVPTGETTSIIDI